MKLGYLELLGQKHPLCFSYAAAAELEEAFGSLEAMGDQVDSDKLSVSVPAINTLLEVLMKAGRIYAGAMGEELPPKLPCKPVELIQANQRREVIVAFRTITGHSTREVETAGKNAEATQGEEPLRGSTTTGPGQD